LKQTFVYSPGTNSTGGNLPLEHLSSSFFEFKAGVEKSFLRRIVLGSGNIFEEDGDERRSMLGRSIAGFMDRASGVSKEPHSPNRKRL